ncbi:ribonuclease H-like domain-containing protein [Fibrobacterota bacterium]
MERLQKKLAQLNKIHLKKKAQLKKTGETGEMRLSHSSFSSSQVREENQIKDSSVNWPEIREDTETFLRKSRPGDKLEEIISCLKPAFRREKCFFRVKRDMNKFWKQHRKFAELFRHEFESKGRESSLKISCPPEKLCFLDIETCGFSGNPLFLIGICYLKREELILDQFFARDYDEESNVLTSFWKLFKKFHTLVTFNGKSFDWPFIEERTCIYGERPPQPQQHLDLLLEARRRWKHRLPNCKLQTLEKVFCRRSRVGDLHGSQIPQAYHDFVNNPGEPAAMGAAIHHNALDIITLAELVLVIMTDEECVGKY